MVRMVTESCGGLAQMVERSLSMREVAGSMPAFSKSFSIRYSLLEKKEQKPKLTIADLASLAKTNYTILSFSSRWIQRAA